MVNLLTNLSGEVLLYISAAGLFASALLWPYLWVQYRRASSPAAAKEAVDSGPRAAEPIRPIAMPETKKPDVRPQPVMALPKPGVAQTLSEVPPKSASERPSLASAPPRKFTPAPAPSAAEMKTGQTSTGGISPAVVYLQSLKNQLDGLKKDVDTLRGQMSAFTQKNDEQFSAILRHLGTLKSQESAPTPSAAETFEVPPAAAESVPPPFKPEMHEPSQEPVPEPATQPPTQEMDTTIQLQVESSAANPPSDPGSDTEPPKRKGPVWPV